MENKPKNTLEDAYEAFGRNRGRSLLKVVAGASLFSRGELLVKSIGREHEGNTVWIQKYLITKQTTTYAFETLDTTDHQEARRRLGQRAFHALLQPQLRTDVA